jgi:hypothetical protein
MSGDVGVEMQGAIHAAATHEELAVSRRVSVQLPA